MTVHPTALAKSRPPYTSWLFWLANAAAGACSWFSKLFSEKKPLSRADEKRRRKALIRKARGQP